MAITAFDEPADGAELRPDMQSLGFTCTKVARINALTVDVEDYFQVEAFKSVISENDWESYPSRVEQNTQRLLDLFSETETHGTFFVLGWVAERFPKLVNAIHRGGHEVASHGYAHSRANSQTPDDFRADVRRAKSILENIIGTSITGYRAPTFSIGRKNWWAYDVLAEEGYRYSSSLYPVSHDLYGTPDAPTMPFRPSDPQGLVEIPLSTVKLRKRNVPCSGGGYFRLLPYAVSRWCINRVVDRGANYIFYCHPWEFDTQQPRIKAGAKSRFRHYTNIALMHDRVGRMLKEFRWDRMDRAFAREIESPSN